MKSFAPFVLMLLLVGISSGLTGHAEEADDRIKKALSRKVSFEFVDTPLLDVFEFVRHLCNVSIVVDPKALETREKVLINLNVNDMEMERALQWVLKIAELEFKVQDQAIFIFAPEKKKRIDAVPPPKAEDKAAGVLRAKFATGDSIEADSAMLREFPHLGREILAMGFDPAKDEILVLASGRDIPTRIETAEFTASARMVAPKASFQFDERLKLLYVQSPDAGDLRRINAIARALMRADEKQLQPHRDPNQKITLKIADQPLKQVLTRIGAVGNFLVLAADKDAVKRFGEPVTLDFNDMDVRECFDMIAQLTEMRYEVKGNTFLFSSVAGKNVNGAVKPPVAPDLGSKNKPKKDAGAELQF
jgi:hypothetical protein